MSALPSAQSRVSPRVWLNLEWQDTCLNPHLLIMHSLHDEFRRALPVIAEVRE